MTTQEFLADFQKIEALAQAGLQTVEVLSPDPTVDVTAAAISAVLPLVSELVAVALTALSKANGQPITIEAIQALLPNATPLTPPDAA